MGGGGKERREGVTIRGTLPAHIIVESNELLGLLLLLLQRHVEKQRLVDLRRGKMDDRRGGGGENPKRTTIRFNVPHMRPPSPSLSLPRASLRKEGVGGGGEEEEGGGR